MDNLERNKRIKNTFHKKFYKKPSWIIPLKAEKKQGVINPMREKHLDENFPGLTQKEQKKQLFK